MFFASTISGIAGTVSAHATHSTPGWPCIWRINSLMCMWANPMTPMRNVFIYANSLASGGDQSTRGAHPVRRPTVRARRHGAGNGDAGCAS